MLKAKRLSLRPSPLNHSYAEALKPPASPASTVMSFETATSNVEVSPGLRPSTSSKPSWLRRASGTPLLRPTSKSPVPTENPPKPGLQAPSLPPRKTKEGVAKGHARRTSYAEIAAGSSKAPDSEDLVSPIEPSSKAAVPPALPPREGIRSRIAAWSNASQGSTIHTRSESSASLASTAAGSVYSQRLPSSASRVFGHAGSAVQKGWAGLRSRGVSGSISSMSSIGHGARRGSMEPSPSWASGLSRRGSVAPSDNELPFGADGPVFQEGVVQRPAGGRSGRVFGRPLQQAGRAWGVVDAGSAKEGMSQHEVRRRACLPALVVRSVEYCESFAPAETTPLTFSGDLGTKRRRNLSYQWPHESPCSSTTRIRPRR